MTRHVKLKHGIATVTGKVKPETLKALDEMLEAAENQMTKEVKTRPILFSTAMVKAILAGAKSQTRRVMKPQPVARSHQGKTWGQKDGFEWMAIWFSKDSFPKKALDFCPFGEAGNRLWVRETHYRYGYWRKDGLTKQGRQRWRFIAVHESRIPEQFEKIYYEATSRPPAVLTKRSAKRGWYKRPSIFLPYALARIVNEITDVRVERLWAITAGDVIAEGVVSSEEASTGAVLPEREARGTWIGLRWQDGWDRINGQRAPWKSNPWVFVISFRRIQPK